MRWLLLLLLTLNVFYYLAHQQQAPFRVHQVAPVEGYTASSSALRLVTEAPPPLRESSSRDTSWCKWSSTRTRGVSSKRLLK